MRFNAAVFGLVAAVICTLAAYAADAPPAPIPPPPSQEYTLKLTSLEIGYIASVLQSRPYTEVAVLLNKMQAQVNAQAPKPGAANVKK